MPITINQPVTRSSEGDLWKITGTYTFSTYTSGGDIIRGTDLGLGQIVGFQTDQQDGYQLDEQIAGNQQSVAIKAFAGGLFTPTALSAANIALKADVSTTKNPIYLAWRHSPEGFSLGIETLPTGASQPPLAGGNVTDSTVGRLLWLGRGCFNEYTTNIVDAAAGAGDTQVYLRVESHVGKGPILGRFVSNNAGAANSMFTVVDGGGLAQEQVPIYFDSNAAEDSYVVSVTKANTDGSRIVAQTQFSQNVYVQTQNGRYITIPSGVLVAGTELFFDDNGADTRLRLKSNIGGGNITNFILNFNGDADIEQASKSLVFVKQATTGDYHLVSAVGIFPNGTKIYIRVGDRVVPVYVDSTANTGKQLRYDQSAAINNRLRADIGADGVIALSIDALPEGFTTQGTVSNGAEVANGTNLAGLGNIEFEAWGR